jgi:hypothetical protein
MPRPLRREFAGAIYHVSTEGIAEHLQMGSWTHVSNLLGARKNAKV